MMKIGINTWVMAACWVVLSGLGIYYTFYRQPEEIEHLQKAEQVAQMKFAEMASLETEEASLVHMADDAMRKWRARYKVIPDGLTTSDVVAYLNDLTAGGFKNFDITLSGRNQTADYSYYVFNFSGRAYYNSLYKLVWELENNRNFYRLHDITLDQIDLVSTDKELGSEQLQVMVSFTGRLEAYFDGIDGASAPDVIDAGMFEDQGIAIAESEDLPPVPLKLLPDVKPATNPFFPAIMETIPPNTYGLIDVEQSELVSIVGEKAVFQDSKGIRSVAVGEKVYLGVVTHVDAATGVVRATLNKGGITDNVERVLNTGERYRQALGPARLTPLN
ncbi:MAG: hypothetical protein WED81_05630 [Rhodothermales bacterium]